MYGPKPPAARPLAHPTADGGLVARMKSADAGPATFGSRGLSQLRDLIPKMQAMGYPQAPTASDPRAAQLQAMIPQMEAMGFKQQPQYFANGGTVRGAGTGTSDSIQARLSHGEYVLPADTVRAVGVGTLDSIREATHKPVKGEQSKAARGFFAGGTPGGVGAWFQDQQREQEQRKQEALAAGQAAEGATQAAAAPTQGGNTSATQAGAYAPGTRGAQLVAAEQQKAQDRVAMGNALVDAIKAPFSKPATPATPSLTAPATQPAATATNPTDMRLAAGMQSSPMAVPGARQDASQSGMGTAADVLNSPSAQPREVVPGVFNHGRGQYSDDPNGMNMPKGFTGQPSAANNAILQRMSDQSQAQSMARVGMSQYDAEVQRAKNINADEAARNNSVGARMQRLADPFTAEGRAMRNLQMNIDSSVDRKGRPTAETAALVAQSKAMSDGYLAEPNQQRTIEAGLEREGMQQAGANARAMLSSGIDQQRVNLASNEFGLKRETQGIANRLATQQEQLRSQIAAEQDPAKRKSLVQRLMDFEGKTQQADPYLVVPGGQNVDPQSGKAYNTPSSVFNRQTGQWIQQPQGQGEQGGAGKFEVGQVYRDSQTGAQRRWNGQAWEKV